MSYLSFSSRVGLFSTHMLPLPGLLVHLTDSITPGLSISFQERRIFLVIQLENKSIHPRPYGQGGQKHLMQEFTLAREDQAKSEHISLDCWVRSRPGPGSLA